MEEKTGFLYWKSAGPPPGDSLGELTDSEPEVLLTAKIYYSKKIKNKIKGEGFMGQSLRETS